ncbi:MAG TPA: nuclear transport factor 2 family protein [Streptosporangiaceae bacterium]|nr:nuclear transport factor 2 family protein [Streptosporangiaceae bacterium]
MTSQSAADEANIRQLIDKLVEAIRARDFEGLRACFAPDMVSFDVGGPPLQTLGAEAKLKNWELAFAVFQPPLNYEIRDLTITVGEAVAFGHSFNRFSGTSGNGDGIGPWVRYTACFQKIDGSWLIAHDQVSVPVDFASGRALLNLEP